MNRRRFLSFLGFGAIAGPAAASVVPVPANYLSETADGGILLDFSPLPEPIKAGIGRMIPYHEWSAQEIKVVQARFPNRPIINYEGS